MKHLLLSLLSIVSLGAQTQTLPDSVIYTVDKTIPSYIDLPAQSRNASEDMKYYLVNTSTGHCYTEGTIPEIGGMIRLGNVPKGIYLFNLVVNNSTTESQKMIFK